MPRATARGFTRVRNEPFLCSRSYTHRAFTLQATGVAMANATYEFMRANATEEMRRVLGAKAANVQLAVPPTLAAGDWNVDSEGDGEGSSGDLHDGVSESDDNN